MHQSAIAMQICQESRGPVTAQTSDASGERDDPDRLVGRRSLSFAKTCSLQRQCSNR